VVTNANDGDLNSDFRSSVYLSSTDTILNLISPVALDKFEIQFESPANNPILAGGNLNISGSNNGVDYTSIFSYTSDSSYSSRIFETGNATAYQYYKFNYYNAGSYQDLSELQGFACLDVPPSGGGATTTVISGTEMINAMTSTTLDIFGKIGFSLLEFFLTIFLLLFIIGIAIKYVVGGTQRVLR